MMFSITRRSITTLSKAVQTIKFVRQSVAMSQLSMLNVVMFSDVMLRFVMPRVIMLSAFKLTVVVFASRIGHVLANAYNIDTFV